MAVLRALALVSAVASVAGIAVRLTVRDRLPGLSTLFYATPLPLIAAGLLFAAAVPGRREFRLGCLSAGLACGLWWWSVGWSAGGLAGSESAVRVAYWNVARGRGGYDAVAEELRRLDADVLALGEAVPDTPEMADFWRAALPGRVVVRFGGGLVAAVRGEVADCDSGPLADGGRYGRCRVTVRGRTFTLVAVDLASDPWRSRRPALEALDGLLAGVDGPAVVMGDFNTPADSAHFAPLRRRFDHAFETAGDGPMLTWPVPLPVLALDHIWVDRRLTVGRCRLGWSWLSDHRSVTVELRREAPGR
jgi:endonuclease/exonuclease/phosphatase (EEP) superfamily protein YafD